MRRRSDLAALLVGVAVALGSPGAIAQDPSSADESLDAQRERFREGLERYRAGAYADAIVIWESIYRELGPVRGYRLAFNLARAYEQFGNATRAAESYETYIAEVVRRRDEGEPLEPAVERQEEEAKERLAVLAATQGRIRITTDRDVIVNIDGGSERLVPRGGLVAYVTPNRTHTLVFHPGTADERTVTVPVDLGEEVELTPPPPAPTTPPPAPSPRVAAPPAPRFTTREERPFDARLLYVAAGVTAVSAVVPIVLYANATGVSEAYDASARSALTNDARTYDAALASGTKHASDYDGARDRAYASIAIPALLGAATVGLATYWLLGKREVRVPVTASVFPGGAGASMSARF